MHFDNLAIAFDPSVPRVPYVDQVFRVVVSSP